jgi:hypothetical protein
MTRPIFVVGCPRSGTTLLRDLLRSHPNLTFPGESRFIPEFYRAYGDPASDEEAWRLARRILSFRQVATNWQITAEPADFTGCRSFAAVTRRLFEIWAAREGKPRWGDKTPCYVGEIPLLLHLFPDAQVVHIIRDGRDVAVSWLRSPFSPGNLYAAAGGWSENVRKGCRDGVLLPAGTYCEVRYENLLAEPEATMRNLCAFLDEPYLPAVLKPRRAVSLVASAASAPSPYATSFRERTDPAFHGTIVRGNSGGWKTALSPSQRTLFESVAGGLLGQLGYPLERLAKPLSRGETLWWEIDRHWRYRGRQLLELRRPRFRLHVLSLSRALLIALLRRASDRAGARLP